MVAAVDVLSDLIFWKLCWVRRGANRAPHVFAKWSQLHLSWDPLNFCFGSPSFVSVCNEDLVGSVSYFLYTFFTEQTKKKKVAWFIEYFIACSPGGKKVTMLPNDTTLDKKRKIIGV
jgi:hypothetical protein